MGGYFTGETARMGSNQMKYKKHTLKDEHFLLTVLARCKQRLPVRLCYKSKLTPTSLTYSVGFRDSEISCESISCV